MQIMIRPILNPQEEIDVTKALVGALAQELWLRFGGNEKINWLEAELHVEGLVGRNLDHSTVPAMVLEARANDAALEERLRRLAARPGRAETHPKRRRARAGSRSHASSKRTRSRTRRDAVTTRSTP